MVIAVCRTQCKIPLATAGGRGFIELDPGGSLAAGREDVRVFHDFLDHLVEDLLDADLGLCAALHKEHAFGSGPGLGLLSTHGAVLCVR